MPFSNKAIKRDLNNHPVPQYFDTVADDYKVLTEETVAIGKTTDAEAESDGSVIGILKRLRTIAGDGLVTLGSAIGARAKLVAGSDGTNARALKTTSDGTVLTQLTGSILEQYGASLATRPAANTVPAGTTFTVVGLNSLTVTISDGANWRAI